MKKIILLHFILFAFSFELLSQGLTQSADGKSSILLEGSAVSIDIAQTELAFGWNNLNQLIVRRDAAWFAGGDIRTKNSKGIGNLLSKGNFSPEGRVNAYAGRYFSNASQIVIDDTKDSYQNKPPSLEEKKYIMIEKYYQSLQTILKDSSYIITNEDILNKEKNSILKNFDDIIIRSGQILHRFHTRSDIGINENEVGISDEIKSFRIQVKSALAKVYKDLDIQSIQDLRRKTFRERKQSLNSNYWRVILFGFGGANAIGFTRFVKLDPNNLADSFEDINDWGRQGGFGFNGELRRWRLGFTYAWVFKNNFKNMSATTYTLKTETLSGTTSLSSEEEITAYAGNYGSTLQNESNIDIVYNLPLNENRTAHLLLNPYLRGNWFSRDKFLLANTTNIGLGFHFFKNDGNFLGGFYIEVPDVNNNIEKAKDLAKQNLRPVLKRFNLGITAKFGLNSVLTW